MAKDLRLITEKDLPFEGIFYLSDGKGGFDTCSISLKALENKEFAKDWTSQTMRYIKEKRLFTRINRPFESFVE